MWYNNRGHVNTTNYYVWSGGKVVYEKIGINEPRNHVYGLGQRLASSYRNSRGGWEDGGMMMMMRGGGPPGDTIGTEIGPGGDPPPSGGDSCYTIMNYFVNDMYGSVRCGVRGTTVLTRLIEYYPYGATYSMSGGGSVYSFLGKEDPGVGMLDLGPRYYDATLGRFMAPDPILAGPSAYSYAEGNPIMLYDPTGMMASPAHMADIAEKIFWSNPQKHGNACEGAHDERMAEYEKNWAELDEESKLNALTHQMDETGVKVEIHVWGYSLDENGEWQKDDGTIAGHVSIRITSDDGSIEYYQSTFPDPNSFLGIGGNKQHTYGDDLDLYSSEVIIDITSGFDGPRDIALLALAVGDPFDSGDWAVGNNCISKTIFDLLEGSFRGPRPENRLLPKRWLDLYGKQTDPYYPMEYRRKRDGIWKRYNPFGD